jgi:hypothetical protein
LRRPGYSGAACFSPVSKLGKAIQLSGFLAAAWPFGEISFFSSSGHLEFVPASSQAVAGRSTYSACFFPAASPGRDSLRLLNFPACAERPARQRPDLSYNSLSQISLFFLLAEWLRLVRPPRTSGAGAFCGSCCRRFFFPEAS